MLVVVKRLHLVKTVMRVSTQKLDKYIETDKVLRTPAYCICNKII